MPERPDFLARRVTSASLRRTDFYNSRDDEKDVEPEEKIFEHNFGASIRKGRGAFGNAIEEPETADKSSSDSSEDDDIGELVEENLGPVVDKNMTIKDAKLFWKTLKQQAVQRNVIKYLEDTSHTTEGASADVSNEDDAHTVDIQDNNQEDSVKPLWNETRSRVDWTSARIHKGTEKDDETTVNRRRSEEEERNNDLLEKKIKELNRESKEIEDMRYKFSATSYRPVKKVDDENDQTLTPAARRRAMFKRSDSDQTEVRHAQRVQLAARKIAKRREQNQIFMAQEIARQLEEAEVKLREVEKEGVEIEKALKENEDTTDEKKPELRRKLCLLYSQRQTILQYEADLRTANEQFSTSIGKVSIKADEGILHSISSDEEDDIDNENDRRKELRDTQLDNTSSDNSSDESIDTAKSDRLPSDHILSTRRTATPTFPDSEQAASLSQDYDSRNEQSSPSPKEQINSSEVEEKQLIDEFENVQIDPEPEEPEEEIVIWECPYCTLHNREEDTYCDACYAWRCCICTFVNENRKRKCEMCYSNRPPRDQGQDERSRESFA